MWGMGFSTTMRARMTCPALFRDDGQAAGKRLSRVSAKDARRRTTSFFNQHLDAV